MLQEILRTHQKITRTLGPEVLVFTTSVESRDHVSMLTPHLNLFAGRGCWNFALDDEDRILRIISEEVRAEEAIRLLQDHGFECRELED